MEPLNHAFEHGQKLIKCLENLTKEGSLRINKMIKAQETYKELSDLMSDLVTNLEVYEVTLPTDPEGKPEFPTYGNPGYRFRPENVELLYDRVEEV